jgi:hypothetical protein
MSQSVTNLMGLNTTQNKGYNPVDANNQSAVTTSGTSVTEQPKPIVNAQDQSKQYLRSIGYPEEAINNLYNINPKQNVLEQIYKSTVPPPTPISEKGIENARLASGIGEGLQTLGDILGAANGARDRDRDFSNSPITQQTTNERNVRNLYDQRLSQYNQGLLNSKVGDYQMSDKDNDRMNNLMLSALSTKQKQDYENAKMELAQKNHMESLGYVWNNKMTYQQNQLAFDALQKQKAREVQTENNIRNNQTSIANTNSRNQTQKDIHSADNISKEKRVDTLNKNGWMQPGRGTGAGVTITPPQQQQQQQTPYMPGGQNSLLPNSDPFQKYGGRTINQ